MIAAARQEGAAEAETRLAQWHRDQVAEQRQRIDRTIEQFLSERREYFSSVEHDVVGLALAIAGKILHRETQVDPMLVAALVRVAIEQMNAGAGVRLRVPVSDAAAWTQYFKTPVRNCSVEVVADEAMIAGDCVLETDLGSASFHIDAQLKEVEQGLFDLLSRRPETT